MATETKKKSAYTLAPADKKLRQFKFALKDVKLVQDHLKAHGDIKKGDLENVPWANIGLQLRTHTQLKLPPGPRNRTRLLTKSATSKDWLEIVPQELQEE